MRYLRLLVSASSFKIWDTRINQMPPQDTRELMIYAPIETCDQVHLRNEGERINHQEDLKQKLLVE